MHIRTYYFAYSTPIARITQSVILKRCSETGTDGHISSDTSDSGRLVGSLSACDLHHGSPVTRPSPTHEVYSYLYWTYGSLSWESKTDRFGVNGQEAAPACLSGTDRSVSGINAGSSRLGVAQLSPEPPDDHTGEIRSCQRIDERIPCLMLSLEGIFRAQIKT
jgi:hypothetical protein